MIINNFEKIKERLNFENPNDYYAIEIIKRRKENPKMSKGSEVIVREFVESKKVFDAYKKSIIDCCKVHNARAYIKLTKKNFVNTSIAVVNNLTKIYNGQHTAPVGVTPEDCLSKSIDILQAIQDNEPWIAYHSPHKPMDTYIRKLGTSKGRVEKKMWMIDFDSFDKLKLSQYQHELIHLLKVAKKDPKILTLPTVNGYHIITQSFNIKKFLKKFPDADIKKDANTLLYYNSNEI